jgi:hypothetical protein
MLRKKLEKSGGNQASSDYEREGLEREVAHPGF